MLGPAPSNARFGVGWSASTDTFYGGASTAKLSVGGGALRVDGEVVRSSAAVMWSGAIPILPTDLSRYRTLALRARGEAHDAGVGLFAQRRGFQPAAVPIALTPAWQKVSIQIDEIPDLTLDDLTGVFIGATTPQKFWIEIDDVAFE